MPFVNVRTAKGLLNEKQKTELCTRLTELMVEIEGAGNSSFRDFIWVLIEEHDPGAWCLGGTQISSDIISNMK